MKKKVKRKSLSRSFSRKLLFILFILLVVLPITLLFINQRQSTRQHAQNVPSPVCLGPCPSPGVSPVSSVSLSPSPSLVASTTVSKTHPCTISPEKQSALEPERNDASSIIQAFLDFFKSLITLLLGLGQAPIPATPTTTTTSPTSSTTSAPASSPTPCASPSQPVAQASTAPVSQPAGSGSAATAQSCTQADIQKLVDSVSEKNLRENLQALVQDDSKPKPNELISRHVSSPGNQIKVDWAKQKMKSYGLEIVDQPFTSGGHNLHNLVARVKGSDPNSLLAAGGHIDSINDEAGDASAEQVAPGAEDDGSGVVVAMEAGRILKGFEKCLKSSIDFVGWNDEEEEMNGSATYVQNLSGKTFKGAISMDMIGYTPDGECLKSDVNQGLDATVAQKVVEMNTKYNIGLNVTHSADDADMGDDASNFWSANLPAAYVLDCSTKSDAGNYPGYHKATDVTQHVNFVQLTKTTKLVVAALAELGSQ